MILHALTPSTAREAVEFVRRSAPAGLIPG